MKTVWINEDDENQVMAVCTHVSSSTRWKDAGHRKVFAPEEMRVMTNMRVAALHGDVIAELEHRQNPVQPAPQVPDRVSMARAHIVLKSFKNPASGNPWFDDIMTAIGQLPEPRKTVATIAFDKEATISRKGDLVKSLQPAVGMSDQQRDALFLEAERLAL